MSSGSFTVTYAVKDMFFDRLKVIKKMDAAKRKSLSKAGAFVQRKAQKTILRRRKRTSPPGKAPSVHAPSGDVASLKNILFASGWGDSVIIGPVGLNQVNQVDGRTSTIPELMEFGGIATINEERWKRPRKQFGWRRSDLRRNRREDKHYRKRRAVYKPRPFMGPALQQTIPEIPEAFKDGFIGPQQSSRSSRSLFGT